VRGWLTWGAQLYGWPPDVTRRQRHGDLLALSDERLEAAERRTG
jgi:hypothetical protein